jgi:hypothetical protein
MIEMTLSATVDRFADVTYALADVDLLRDWAWQAYRDGVRYAFFRTYEELRELAANTAAERAASGPALTLAQRALALYHGAYREMWALLIGLPDVELDRVPAEDEWPLRRVLDHAIEADGGFYGVIGYALERQRSGDERPAEIPREYWHTLFGPHEEAGYQAALAGTKAEIQAYHAALHNRMVREFATITDDEIALPSRYWEGYSLPIQFRLHRLESHIREHTIQIEKTLDMLGRRPAEAMRLLRLIYAALADAEGAAIGAPLAGVERQAALAATIARRADEVAAIVGTEHE